MADIPNTTIASDEQAELATMADYAAMAFEPLSKETLEAIKPDDTEWGVYAKSLRFAYLVLGKTKEETKEAARKLGEKNAALLFESFDCTSQQLRAYADVVDAADVRLLSAFASLAEAADA